MSIIDHVVLAYCMQCNICRAEGKRFLSREEVISDVRQAGWQNKIFYNDKQIAVEEWKCPPCITKEPPPLMVPAPEESKEE